MPDLTDIVTWLRKTDAFHDPSEANDLMSAAADEIERLRRAERLEPSPESRVSSPDESPADMFWRALMEIAFANFEAGTTPDYVRDHARDVLLRATMLEEVPHAAEP